MTEAELYTMYKGVYVPTGVHSPESLKNFEEFSFRPDDILIVTYPKSGKFLLLLVERTSVKRDVRRLSRFARRTA